MPFLVGWPLTTAFIITVAGGMGAGKLWAVRLFRWSAYGAAACYLPLLGVAIYAFTADAPRQLAPLAPDTAITQFIISALELIAFFVLFRALRLAPCALARPALPAERMGAARSHSPISLRADLRDQNPQLTRAAKKNLRAGTKCNLRCLRTPASVNLSLSVRLCRSGALDRLHRR
ncbi:hypothetical protein [Aliidongia dinghuensis]|uniref:hypothetical protein n=1 Tax=Aliidongia dinghuensis TaxID=1867774 RepID=UPI001E4A1FB1|nr:hypothetical protein [Aliidongia dinghuensis]